MKRLATIVLGFLLCTSTIADNTLLVGNIGMSGIVDQIGGAAITIPIEVPAGVKGMQPNLSLVYNGINRGYTMHEHLDEFELINMNGRVYDPAVAQFLSPDPYIQDAGNWLNYNRYAYCYNNPTRYTDPSGEIIKTFLADFITTLFTGGLNFWNKEAQQNAWRKFDPTAPWSKTYKAAQIDKGLFKTDPNRNFWGRTWQFISRFTWELPQTVVGNVWSDIRNITGKVDRVDYYGGATFVTNENASTGGGVSIGSYININIEKGPIDRPFNDYMTYNPTYMHEYGHYIQSQMMGPLYVIPAISSGLHTLINKGRTMTYNYWSGIPVSSDHWTETWANRLASRYFGKYKGVDWERDRFWSGNKSLPLHIYYPLESYY